MKIKNDYTEKLIAPSKYNPNEFTSVGAVCFYIVLLLLFIAVPLTVRLTGFSDTIKTLAENDYYLYMVLSAVVSQGLILLSAVVFSLIKRTNPLSGGGYIFRFDFTPMLFGCALISGLQICFSSLHTEFAESASAFGPAATIPVEQIKGDPVFASLYLFIVVAVPCIVEEIAFRGIIMRGLNRFGGFAAVLISSAMFSLFHGNVQQIILQFLGGLAIGACAYITGNIAQGVAMHMFNNLFAQGFAVLSAVYGLNRQTSNVFTVCATLCGLTMLIIGLWYFINYEKNVKRPFSVYEEDETSPEHGEVKLSPLYGRERKRLPLLMSSAEKNAQASIVIDISKLGLFKKYYPQTMRFSRGAFVSLNKETHSPAPAITLITVSLAFAVIRIVFNLFGF